MASTVDHDDNDLIISTYFQVVSSSAKNIFNLYAKWKCSGCWWCLNLTYCCVLIPGSILAAGGTCKQCLLELRGFLWTSVDTNWNVVIQCDISPPCSCYVWDLTSPSSLGGVFFRGYLFDLFNDHFSTGALRIQPPVTVTLFDLTVVHIHTPLQ